MSTPNTASNRYARSCEEHDRRNQVIAGGVNSNVRLAGSPAPLTFERAEGAYLWDVDGNRYVDFAAGMGPMVLGHSHPAVNAAVNEAIASGQLFAGQNLLEAEFAELLVDSLPWVEQVRVGLTGTEMDLLAVRIARAATGNNRVIRFFGHYHGWLDPMFVDMSNDGPPNTPPSITPGQSRAAADEVIMCDWNDVEQVEAALAEGDVACVVMEPVMCNTGLIAPSEGYLEAVKSACHRHGALLVIDEVITGFRLGLTGAQGYFGINGDISVYAKAIASGFPLAALGTSKELLAAVGRGEVNHSGTYNTGLAQMAAGVATVRTLIDDDPYAEIERVTQRLVEGIRQLASETGIELAVDHLRGGLLQTRFGPTDRPTSLSDFRTKSDGAQLGNFLSALQDQGVRPTGRGLWFVSAAHDDQAIDTTLEAIAASLAALTDSA